MEEDTNPVPNGSEEVTVIIKCGYDIWECATRAGIATY